MIALPDACLANHLGCHPRITRLCQIARRRSADEPPVARRVEPTLCVANGCENDRRLRLLLASVAAAGNAGSTTTAPTARTTARTTAPTTARSGPSPASPAVTAMSPAVPLEPVPSPIPTVPTVPAVAVRAVSPRLRAPPPALTRGNDSGARASIVGGAVAISFRSRLVSVTFGRRVSSFPRAFIRSVVYGSRRGVTAGIGGSAFAVRVVVLSVHNGANASGRWRRPNQRARRRRRMRG
jgi:hypothetical protein